MRLTLLTLLFIAFGAVAQTLSFAPPQALTKTDASFHHPHVSPDGRIFFTQSNYGGLYYLDSSGTVRTVSAKPGAGYEPVFSSDAKTVYYRTYIYKGPRRSFSMFEYDMENGTQKALFEEQRNPGMLRALPGNGIVLWQQDEKRVIKKSPNEQQGSFAYIENSAITLNREGVLSTLQPRGAGHYIWPSVSPDGNRLLFTKAGEGTFISDLQGNVLVELGYANAPQWSPDGQWIIYMKDRDDGHRVLASDIFVTSADGRTTIAVTESADRIELYPQWSPQNDFVVFGTEQGVIYKAEIERE